MASNGLSDTQGHLRKPGQPLGFNGLLDTGQGHLRKPGQPLAFNGLLDTGQGHLRKPGQPLCFNHPSNTEQGYLRKQGQPLCSNGLSDTGQGHLRKPGHTSCSINTVIALHTFRTAVTYNYKMAKGVHGNWSDGHCNRSDAWPVILLAPTLPPPPLLYSKQVRAHTHHAACTLFLLLFSPGSRVVLGYNVRG